MPDRARLERRLRTVERTLTGDDHDLEELHQRGELVDRVATLEAQLSAAEERIDELEGATQALRGYVGNVRSVNEDVERRAEAAVAAVDRLETRLDDRDQPTDALETGPARGSGRQRPDRAETATESRRRDRCPKGASARRSSGEPDPGECHSGEPDTRNDTDASEDTGVLDRLRARL